MEARRYLDRVAFEPVPYFAYGLLTRFQAKHSSVLATRVEGAEDVVAAALRSPGGNLTLYLLNLRDAPQPVRLRLAGANVPEKLFLYQVTEAALGRPDFALIPQRHTVRGAESSGTIDELLPARSLTALTTWQREAAENGVFRDE